MKKLGFIAPWYGDSIPGGAETELRGIVKHLAAAGVELEVLSTSVEKFMSDWSVDFHKPGLTTEGGINVRRFKVRKRNTAKFDAVNAKLIANSPVTPEEEETFMREMVNSPDLYTYIQEHEDEYSLFIHIPYMFGTAYYGALAVPEKTAMIPCFHEESYAHMDIYKKAFEEIAGLIYLSSAEKEVANSIFDFSLVEEAVLGAGVDTDFDADAQRFRDEYKINDPFILYAGRKDAGKNIYLLINYFREYRMRNPESTMKLVLIGGGDVTIPEDIKSEIIDLGFVDRQVKYDACAASLCLCQPSIHESFSIVIMESWLCGRPALVHSDCAVTKSFAVDSNSGLYFGNYFEFEGCINYLMEHPDVAEQMGKTGREFVLQNFSWDVIVKRYTDFFKKLSGEKEG
ncbi:MAG: glycosyltransferase family 4 protein [Saccharofermentans sp.]|nr:glycosyltransferase family 4 protein [Saccharofermentans sp.]